MLQRELIPTENMLDPPPILEIDDPSVWVN